MINVIEHLQKSRFLKFLFVGGINTLFGYSIFSLCIYLNMHYVFATLIATCLGILFNFKTFGRFVFDNTDNKLIFKFISVYLLAYFINILLIKLSTYFTTNIYIAGAIATLIGALFTYTLNKNLVFRTSAINLNRQGTL